MARKASEEDKKLNKEQCAAMFEVFMRFIDANKNEEDPWIVLEELMALRAEFSIQRALKGFELDYESAIKLLRDAEGLSPEESEKRKIIVAAVENLVDFAVAAEYNTVDNMPFDFEDLLEGEVDVEEIDFEEIEDEFELYNLIYAGVENADIEYSMSVALSLLAHLENTSLTYMTMGDERVRPWHLQYEGYTAPKALFPEWLIPPIEHMCRCYLIEDSSVNGSVSLGDSVLAQKELEMPEWFNPTFKESVAKGGRIFSDEHPYFKVPSKYMDKLTEISKRIKSKYYGK